ncbi:MAG: hypothetical protein KBD64_01480 [Gammaproteobacteria bacterium]|nr:hypothetical protein [Gammaproteobacteria bacterium]
MPTIKKLLPLAALGAIIICSCQALAVCGDGIIDVDANGQPTESCDLGSMNSDTNELSGCDSNCKVKPNGWTCTNTQANWQTLSQDGPRSLKNLFINLVKNAQTNGSVLATCTTTSGNQICQNYIKDMYEFKRLNVNNPLNTSAKIRCSYSGTALTSLPDPEAGSSATYPLNSTNCGADDPSNPEVSN